MNRGGQRVAPFAPPLRQAAQLARASPFQRACPRLGPPLPANARLASNDLTPALLAAQGLPGAGRRGGSHSSPPLPRGGASPPPRRQGASTPQPSSTLLEQMARRVLLSSGGQRGAPLGLPGGPGPWDPPAGVRDHPEAQALAEVYPELSAQIQLLSQQLAAVQAQLTTPTPRAEEPGERGAAPPAPTAGGGGVQAHVGRVLASPPAPRQPPPPAHEPAGWQAPASNPHPAPSTQHPGFTAEDLLKAFAAGGQHNGGDTAPSRGGAGGLEGSLAGAGGADPSLARTTPPPAQDPPPQLWGMLQALMQHPRSPDHGGSAAGRGQPARRDGEAPSASAMEQLTAALRAAGEAQAAPRGRDGGDGGSGRLPMSDMLALLTSMGRGGA